jgi:hypothetical protein
MQGSARLVVLYGLHMAQTLVAEQHIAQSIFILVNVGK